MEPLNTLVGDTKRVDEFKSKCCGWVRHEQCVNIAENS